MKGKLDPRLDSEKKAQENRQPPNKVWNVVDSDAPMFLMVTNKLTSDVSKRGNWVMLFRNSLFYLYSFVYVEKKLKFLD